MTTQSRTNVSHGGSTGKAASFDAAKTRTLTSPPIPVVGPGSGATNVHIDGDLLELGVTCDEFELLRYIGGGGMGDVWLAQDAQLNRLVALKVLHSDKRENREVVQRFRCEAQCAAMLNHQNIAQVYVFRESTDNHRLYLAMEYVSGANLRDWVKEHGPMPVADAISIALQIAYALAHLDDRNVVHRDIKPSNILLTPGGAAKLIDFGLARVMETSEEENCTEDAELSPVRADITASGVTLGTFDYISPEQARDPRTVDIRSDIYSLGCTLYYIFTGHPPFPQGNPLQKLLQHQSDDPLDVRSHRVDVPESMNRVLNRAMKKNREERYSTPMEMVHDLEDVARETGLIPEFGVSTLASTRWVPSNLPRESIFSWSFVRKNSFWMVPLVLLVSAMFLLSFLWGPTPEETTLPPPAPTLPPAQIED